MIRTSLERAEEDIIHPDDVDVSDIDTFAEKHGWQKDPIMSVSHFDTRVLTLIVHACVFPHAWILLC